MKHRIKRLIECILVFLSVGTLYFIIECIYKQRLSHWSMFILAGSVGLLAMLLNDTFSYELDFGLQVSICTLCTVVLEYVVGRLLNSDYSIWDYRDQVLNLDGQICLGFSFMWFCMFVVLIPILDYVEWKVFKYKEDVQPYYKLFRKAIFRLK